MLVGTDGNGVWLCPTVAVTVADGELELVGVAAGSVAIGGSGVDDGSTSRVDVAVGGTLVAVGVSVLTAVLVAVGSDVYVGL